jgi:molybdopterin-guanine dinucleotide biosynthesis protein A
MRDDEIAAVVLVGGRSSRMGGGDKPLLPLAGRPILAHVLERLQPQIGRIAINANGDSARFAEFGLPVVADTVPGFAGPLAGLLAGMAWAAGLPGASTLATVAGDTPFFPADLIAKLPQAPAGHIGLAASAGRTHPVFGLWPLALRADLARFIKDGGRRVMDFVARHPVSVVDFPIEGGGDPFFNINTPEDLAAAERLVVDTRP